ncbi:ankyrin, partial [Anaeromyces robustus]
TSLMVACKNNLIPVVKLFLEYHADVNIQDSEGYTSLMMACSRNNLNLVKVLLSHESTDINKPTKEGCTPLMRACQIKNVDITVALIEAGADIYAIDEDQQTALHCACDRKLMKIVEKFL